MNGRNGIRNGSETGIKRQVVYDGFQPLPSIPEGNEKSWVRTYLVSFLCAPILVQMIDFKTCVDYINSVVPL